MLKYKNGKWYAQRKTEEGLQYSIVTKMQPQSKVRRPFRPLAMMLSDVNGQEIEFLDINTPDEVRIGVKATVNDVPAQGEHMLPDGTRFLFDKGVLVEIKQPAAVQAAIKRRLFAQSLNTK
jgi:hypothetical protein